MNIPENQFSRLTNTLVGRSVRSADGCLIWQGSTNKQGYGRLFVSVDDVVVASLAHRVAWEIANGPIPPGMKVCHRCDNPPCVETAHHFLGTQLDNLTDMKLKGRERRHLGGRKHTFTEEAMREALGSGMPVEVIASQLGVNRATVFRWRKLFN